MPADGWLRRPLLYALMVVCAVGAAVLSLQLLAVGATPPPMVIADGAASTSTLDAVRRPEDIGVGNGTRTPPMASLSPDDGPDTPTATTGGDLQAGNDPGSPAPVELRSEPAVAADAVAVIAYVPDGSKFLSEVHHMLHGSWARCTAPLQLDPDSRPTDLVLFSHRDAVAHLPGDCVVVDPKTFTSGVQVSTLERRRHRCVVVEQTPNGTDYWGQASYEYMRSLVYVHDGRYRRLLLSYSKLLRTDLDVFLTPSFFTWRPTRFVTGRGAYSTMWYTQARLVGIAEKLGLRHRRAFCVGSTWFGDSKTVIALTNLTEHVARHFLDNEFGPDEEIVWPKWWRGVTSMYAGELAVNHLLDDDEHDSNPSQIDADSTSKDPTAGVYHIHCWQGITFPRYFSKTVFFYEQRYTKEAYPQSSLDPDVIRDYCMLVALYG
ncbi:unnamed protein product (mitochondrion) [Plasmodiophora brassicae]|uniref:DUF7164 domain-containing protein n=2 Tax=Plasmodiophora brassicae TaxID=37360 RepID=A0A3P3YD01_PLABS|nr:unnamed protein product [Plasmodiophora brassicae]